jgi:hypothetical protein
MNLSRSWILMGMVASVAWVSACTDDSGTKCGPGTQQVGGQCVPIADAAPPDAAQSDAATTTAKCGDHAVLVDGQCRGLLPVGSPCAHGSECDIGTCLLETDSFPGGYCSIPSCNDIRSCPTGSDCVFSGPRGHSVCLAFCSGTTECRDGYVCQPLYGSDVSVCSPSCVGSDTCPDQTVCDSSSGLCVLRECDPTVSSSDCGDNRICYPDPKHITTKGGLCLSTCDPAASKCEAGDVCQPLPDDPAHHGICAPPVCKTSTDCSVGSICKDTVCQPPARCDDAGACADDTTSCVGGAGGQCMPKCSDNDACTAIHADLTCASNVASDSVCLPIGSYAGSACRSDKNSQCDDLTVGQTSAKMACENDTCVIACGSGGDALCKAIRGDLNCASGVYEQPVCLPSGTYPGGPCGGSGHDTCSDVSLGQGVSAKQLCKNNQCVFDCGHGAIGSTAAEKYCSAIDPTLTCATTVFPNSAVCLPQGSYPGGPCSHGTCSKLGNSTMACEDNACLVTCTPDNPATQANEDACGAVDPSLMCAHGIYASDVCLPKGSFPGSACGGTNHDQCAQDLKGVSEIDMQCVNNTCVIGCSESGKWSGYGDALCSVADPSLTCVESTSLCVKTCNSGACDTGYSCLDAGASPAHQNACLPNGSFPGSACAPSNTCAAGPDGTTMSCHSGACVVECPGGGMNGDTLCGMVSAALTCSDAGGDLCVPACNVAYGSSKCPSGLSCLASSGENTCLPDGSFLGAACAGGTTCSGSPMLVCVPGSTALCGAGCTIGTAVGAQATANGYCTQVGSSLGTGYNTCTALSANLHVCTSQ